MISVPVPTSTLPVPVQPFDNIFNGALTKLLMIIKYYNNIYLFIKIADFFQKKTISSKEVSFFERSFWLTNQNHFKMKKLVNQNSLLILVHSINSKKNQSIH